MRTDPSCLLSRVLHEISSTVTLQVGATELMDFGVFESTKRVSEPKRDAKPHKKQSRQLPRRMQKGRNRKDKGKRQTTSGVIQFVFEKTKENQVMCIAEPTKRKQLMKSI
eukprot:94393_1